MPNKRITNPSLEDISEEVASDIMSMPFLNKESIKAKLLPLLRIWLPNNTKAKKSKATPHKLQWVIEKTDIERIFWLNKCRDMYTPEQMEELYKEQHEDLETKGYKTYNHGNN